MKKLLTGLTVLTLLTAGMAQGQTLRGPVTTTAYSRQLFTNSTSSLWRSALGVGVDGTNTLSFNTDQFALDNNAVSVMDGALLTNPLVRVDVSMVVTGNYGGYQRTALPQVATHDAWLYLYAATNTDGLGLADAYFKAVSPAGTKAGTQWQVNATSNHLWGFTAYGASPGGWVDEGALYLTYANGAYSWSPIMADQATKTLGLYDKVTVYDTLKVSGLITNSALETNRVIITGVGKELTNSTVTATELGYLAGLTTNVQYQFSQKLGTTNGSATNLTLTGSTTNAGVIYGAVLASQSVATNPIVEGAQLIKNSTPPTAAPTNAAYVFVESGELEYLTSKASEGTEATNRVHNRSAVVIAAGDGTALGGSFAAVDFTTTDPNITLPSAGTYWLQAQLVMTNLTLADLVQVRLYNIDNGGSPAAVAGSTNALNAYAATTNLVSISTTAFVTVGAADTIRMDSVNLSGNRGVPMAPYTKISYIRLH